MKLFFCATVLLALIASPEYSLSAARDALRIWGLDVAPSLFPYMVFCRLLSENLRRSGFPAVPAVALLGLLGGSPSGASVLAAYGQTLPRKKLAALCAMTGTISPMYLMGTVGAWLRNPSLSRLLFACHALGALLCAGIVWALPAAFASDSSACPPISDEKKEADPIAQSVEAILSVGGCIVVFSVLAAFVRRLPGVGGALGALIHAMLEVSGGMHALCALSLPASAQAIYLAAVSGFGGLSILSQNLVFLRPLGVSERQLLSMGMLRAALCALAMALLYPLSFA